MNNYGNFEELLLSDCEEVVHLATKAKRYYVNLTENKITSEEFNDLIDDLTNLENINSSLYSADIWNKIMGAVTIIKTLRAMAII